MVICLQRDADLYMAQLMPLPLTVSCYSIIQIGFTFLVPARSGSPGQRAVKRVCMCVYYRHVSYKSINAASHEHYLMAVEVDFHCDVVSCELARHSVWHGVAKASMCGRGNMVSLTSILNRRQFFPFIIHSVG